MLIPFESLLANSFVVCRYIVRFLYQGRLSRAGLQEQKHIYVSFQALNVEYQDLECSFQYANNIGNI